MNVDANVDIQKNLEKDLSEGERLEKDTETQTRRQTHTQTHRHTHTHRERGRERKSVTETETQREQAAKLRGVEKSYFFVTRLFSRRLGVLCSAGWIDPGGRGWQEAKFDVQLWRYLMPPV